MIMKNCKHLNRYKTYAKNGDVSYTYDCDVVILGDAECLINCDKYEAKEFDKDIELLADEIEFFMKNREDRFSVTDANGRKALNIDNFGNVHINSDIKTNNNIKNSSFKAITTEMLKLYEIKNKNYGNSFSEQFKEYGMTSVAIRLDDKIRRIKSLLKQNDKANIDDESFRDTLIDLANYSVLAIMEIDKGE